MKHEMPKKVFSWLLVTLMLIASFLSPLTVMAGNTKPNYDNLFEAAYIRYLVKIADTCLGEIYDSEVVSLTSDSNSDERSKLRDFYNLKNLPHGNNGTTLYDSYVEILGQGNHENNTVWCSEVLDGTDVIPDLLSRLNLYYVSELPNIICGKGNSDGLFKIKMGYTSSVGDRQYIVDSTDGWPENDGSLRVDSNNYATDCKAALKKIQYYADTNDQLGGRPPRKEYIPFGVQFIVNKNFRFEKYLKDEYLSKYNASINELTYANKYLAFTNSCISQDNYKTKEQYDLAIQNNASNYYKIYNSIVMGKNGPTIQYLMLPNPDMVVYWSQPDWGFSLGSLDGGESSTCRQLAEDLSPENNGTQEVVGENKFKQINACYNTAQQNIDNLKSIKNNLDYVKGLAVALQQAAEGIYESKTYRGGHVSDEDLYWTRSIETWAKKIGDNGTIPTSIRSLIGQSQSFEEKVHSYYNKQQNGDLTAEEKEVFKGEIDNYKETIKTFDEQVIKKVKDGIEKAPNISLNSANKLNGNNTKDYNDKVENFYEFDNNGTFTCVADNILSDIKTEIENIIGTKISFSEYVPPTTDTDNTNTNPEAITADCYDAGLDSMSWILCPVINNTSQAIDGIEEWVLGLFLEIDTDMVFKDQTYTAWEVFRNIANVVIIIIFLVVIFSQLTGVGIDNYGIKKLLPRLIVISILINLSYIICELAVDLSNILGVGLDNMFQGIGTAIRGGAGGAEETLYNIVAGLFGALAGTGMIGGIVVTAIGSTGGGVMLVISLLLTLIVALVAVLMFFVMLGARMMIVIIFTIISPVAFALYILPNTQNLFKKWWKIFQAALVVFPICGALYGASFIIKAIIFGGGEINFFWGLIAVCAPFLPFLLLPTLLKSTLAGLGALGGTLTMLGNGLRKGLSEGSGAFRNTDAYKERAQLAKENAAAARAQRIHNRLSGRTNLSEKQRERLRRADDTVLAHNKRLSENSRRTASDAYFNAMLQKQEIEGKAEEDTISRYNDANYRAARMQSLEDEAASRRISDQQALIMAGLEYEDSGGKKRVNANNLQSVSDYHKYLLGQVADSSRSKEERATSMERVKAVQNILSGTDKGRGYVQQNIEDAIRSNRTMGLSEAASHLFVNYGDKYKAANRGAHAMISDLATSQTDADGNLASTAVSSIQSKLNGANGNEYSMAGIDKYTAESLASADEEAIDRLVNAYGLGQPGDQLGDVTDTTSKAYKIASTAYSAMNNPNISTKLKPEVKDKLEKLIYGYTPSVTPEAAMIDAQYQNFQVNHQIYAQRVGKNAAGEYPVPSGFQNLTNPNGIYTDNNGHTYNAKNNTFS